MLARYLNKNNIIYAHNNTCLHNQNSYIHEKKLKIKNIMQQYEGWELFKSKPTDEKAAIFSKEDGGLFDVIYAQQFTKAHLEELFVLADKVREIATTQRGMNFLRTILSDKRAMLFFVQPSTRTFLFFFKCLPDIGNADF